MNRYTEKVDGIWSVSCKYEEPPYPVVTQEVIDRLAAIEDILGDEYDLDRLRELVQADREGRCVVLNMPRRPKCLPMPLLRQGLNGHALWGAHGFTVPGVWSIFGCHKDNHSRRGRGCSEGGHR